MYLIFLFAFWLSAYIDNYAGTEDIYEGMKDNPQVQQIPINMISTSVRKDWLWKLLKNSVIIPKYYRLSAHLLRKSLSPS